MNSKEFTKLKNSIAIKSTIKIIIYSVIAMLIFLLIVDVIFQDEIASMVYKMSAQLYYFFVANKGLVFILTYLLIFAITTFIVIQNMNNYMVKIMESVDSILKNPEKEISLPSDLAILENKLNTIRIDLIRNKNIANEAIQKKDDLIMYMAHDLKTPLTSIIGYLTLLTQEKEISQNLKEKYMNIALDKSLRVEELINEFFEITRYNLQDMPINKKKIDLSFLIDQLVDECYPMLQEKNLKCVVNKSAHIYFLGDGDKLARAFENLLKNAINYSYENTEILINMEEKDNDIKISFKNKGDKIPKYKLEKIFDKFYRVDESRSTKTGGTGLGLAITKEIIELHSGTIVAKNDDDFIEFCIELHK